VERRVEKYRNLSNTPAIRAADGISSPPHTSLPKEEALNEWDFVPEGKQRVWCPATKAPARMCTRCGTPTPNLYYQTSRLDRRYGEWVDSEPEEHFEEGSDAQG
jgi:hypothetical protein